MKYIQNIIYFFLLSVLLFGDKNESKVNLIKQEYSLEHDEELKEILWNSFLKLRETYVDSINETTIINSAIRGMCRPLDPYTILVEGKTKDHLEMLSKGRYGGVGIQISTRRDTLIVLSPMEDSPAYIEGLQSGDKILKVDTTNVVGMKLDNASKLIRGELGTIVELKIFRPSTKELLVFPLTRANIKVNDLPYYGVDENNIGYIRITKFSRYVARDFRSALLELVDLDIEGLVIDLRGNSGGLLSNALSILDVLTDKNILLLKTQGRAFKSNRTIVSRLNPLIDTSLPISVLIDRSSASASEIVAGVLQDLDLAVIIGEKSFGKGLVQSMYQINDTTKLKVTTAKYYIPSGRLIQKRDYLDNGVLTDGLDKKDSLFTTSIGRIVKGGDGIIPDIHVSREKIPPFVQQLWKQGVFLNFAAYYAPMHDLKFPINITNEIIDEFKIFLKDYNFQYKEYGEVKLENLKEDLKILEKNEKSIFNGIIHKLMFWKKHTLTGNLDRMYKNIKENPFNSKNNLKWIKNGLLRELSRVIGGNPDRVKASLKNDIVYHKSVEVLLDSVVYKKILSLEIN
jgi:carboxyl-terminal processing protease